jgi:hypothetical protein
LIRDRQSDAGQLDLLPRTRRFGAGFEHALPDLLGVITPVGPG